MKIEAGAATDVGRVRQGNEDGYLMSAPLYVVADGMGGHRGGEVASGLALETLEELFAKQRGSLIEQVKQANRAVFERSAKDPAVEGMGTTLTAALQEGETIHLAHVGDSRAYLFRAGTLRLLTEDHTLVERMVRSGEITRAEADIHPHRNVLTRVLGTEGSVQVDEQSLSLLEGDRIVLCTDGLTGMVTEEQIGAILGSASNAQDAADRLVRAANHAGGADNITVIVLDAVEGEDESASAAVTRGGASKPNRRLPGKWIRRGAFAALIVIAAIVATKIYIDRQWYVGESAGKVAVYQGIPARFAGLHFSRVIEVERDLPAPVVQSFPLYMDLPSGITTSNRTQAEQIVTHIRVLVRGTPSGGSTGSGPGSVSATPLGPPNASPISPGGSPSSSPSASATP